VIAFASLAIETGTLSPLVHEYITSSLTGANALLGIITQAREFL
jgi:hypothetical protein